MVKYLRIPGRLGLHVWWPGKFDVVIADRATGHRLALVVRDRVVLRVRA